MGPKYYSWLEPRGQYEIYMGPEQVLCGNLFRPRLNTMAKTHWEPIVFAYQGPVK